MQLIHIPSRPAQYIFTILTSTMLILGGMEFVSTWQDFSNQWYWLILATYYTVTMNETFAHRIVAHGMFDINVKSWTYKVLTFFTAVDQCHGPLRSLTLLHFSHHKFSDQGYKDWANFRCFWFGSAWCWPFVFFGPTLQIPQSKSYIENQYHRHKEVIDDPWTMFCEKYNLVISITTLIALYFLLPVVLFKIILMGRFIMTLGMMTVSLTHVKWFPFNYRVYNTPDQSCNNLILHYMFLGILSGLLQNAHHGKPMATNLSSRWYEIDTSVPVVWILKYLLSKKPS